MNSYESVIQGLEDNLWFYNSIVKDNVIAIHSWQNYIYDLYMDKTIRDENRLVILTSEYKRYLEMKELLDTTLDKFEINVFYRDYIKFKKQLINRDNSKETE